MRSIASLGLLVVASAAALAGCAPSAPEGLGEVESIEQVRDAYVAAGGECEWTRTDDTTGACGSDSILLITSSEAEQQQILEQYEVVSEVSPLTAVVGSNWIVTAPDAAEVHGALGGELVAYGE